MVLNGTQATLSKGDLVYTYGRNKQEIPMVFVKINSRGLAYCHRTDGIGNNKDVRRDLDKVFLASKADENGNVSLFPAVKKVRRKTATPSISLEAFQDQKKREMLSKFSINKRFQILKSLVRLTAFGKRNALIITGKGGLGKTYTVREVLMAMGFRRHRLDSTDGLGEDENATDSVEIERDSKEWADVDEEGDYVVIGGSLSEKGLYDIMSRHRNKLLIFDDCDDIWKKKKMADLLKNGLDNKAERFISWAVHGDINQFQFFGQIIFISNLDKNKMDKPVMTRCSTVDVSMTPDEMIERMQTIIDSDKYMNEISMEIKQECLALIAENKEAEGISMRTLEEVIIYRNEDPDEWRDLAEYSIYS
jgi:hypothetical protein